MKKLTASNETERPSKGPLDMRSIPIEEAGKKTGLGPRFTKIGGGAAAAGGSRFKKVGVAVSGSAGNYDTKAATEPAKVDNANHVKTDSAKKVELGPLEKENKAPDTNAVPEQQAEPKKDEDILMSEADDRETVAWEPYDFTKPTGCPDHANCPGCKTSGFKYDEDGWLILDDA